MSRPPLSRAVFSRVYLLTISGESYNCIPLPWQEGSLSVDRMIHVQFRLYIACISRRVSVMTG